MVTVNSSCYPNYPRGWEGSGPVPEPVQNDNDLAAMERNSPPLTVARALREHCHIPYENFFLAAHLGGGKFAYFQGPRPLSEEEVHLVFKREKFLTFSNKTRSREDLSQTHEEAYGLDGSYSARTAQHFEDQWPMESRRRKRPRRHVRRAHDDDAPPIIASSKKAIEIGDSDAVLGFYDRGFKAIQQTACKEVAKAFIKVICPKKQANFPYRKGSETAPDWWPEPWGPGEKDMARHVEPDHLWKRERVHVLKHILRLIIEPETQPPSIRRLGHISVAMLETAAMESLSIWFQDANKPKNAKKRPILKELFKVAKMEEKYKRNEIDANTQVFVTADDMMDYCFDEDEPDEDMEEPIDAAVKHDRTDSVSSSQVSPARTAAMPVLPTLSPTSSTINTLSAQFQATQFLHDMPMRATQYGGPAMDLNPDQYGYHHDGLPREASLQAHPAASLQMHDMLAVSPHHHHHHQPHHHDTSRRSSMFTPTTEFGGHSPSAMYHSPWSQSQSPQSQGTPSTTAASPEASSPMFAYAPTHHAQQHAALPSLPLPMPMAQHHQHQHQQTTNPYAGQYSPHDTLAQHQHHQQQQQQQQQQHHVFRAGSIQLSMQQHHPGAGGYGQGQG